MIRMIIFTHLSTPNLREPNKYDQKATNVDDLCYNAIKAASFFSADSLLRRRRTGASPVVCNETSNYHQFRLQSHHNSDYFSSYI